jgi:multidrug resistance efflux pump
MKKALLIVGLLAVVALSLGVLAPRLLRQPSQETGMAALGEAAPQAGQSLITGRGIVIPEQWSELSFPIGGQLAEIRVTAGMTVTVGQILALLAPDEMELQVRLAEASLEAQQAQLDQLLTGGSEADMAAAQANLAAAQASHQELLASPGEQEKALAEADLMTAQRALQQAQAAYDAVRNLPDIASRPEALRLEQATVDYQRAQAAHALVLAGPSEAELRLAESHVASARAQLEALTASQPGALRAAQAEVTRAKIALEQAKRQLGQSVLTAPFDGTITSVAEIRQGDTVAAGTSILIIADLSQLMVELTDLDEWSAANVGASQTVDLVVPALNNRSLRGRVSFVSREPTLSPSGAAFYKALVILDQQDAELRWGYSVRTRLYVPGARGVGFR